MMLGSTCRCTYRFDLSSPSASIHGEIQTSPPSLYHRSTAVNPSIGSMLEGLARLFQKCTWSLRCSDSLGISSLGSCKYSYFCSPHWDIWQYFYLTGTSSLLNLGKIRIEKWYYSYWEIQKFYRTSSCKTKGSIHNGTLVPGNHNTELNIQDFYTKRLKHFRRAWYTCALVPTKPHVKKKKGKQNKTPLPPYPNPQIVKQSKCV